jgi:hypothetical protein
MSEIFSVSFRYGSIPVYELPRISQVPKICRVIRELRFQRSLWLEALSRIREIELQPLPLSTPDSLDKLSLCELQTVARRADRLRRNLESENPRPAHIRSLPARGRIFVVPGAHLAVAHSPGFVTCWDIVSSQMVGRLEIPHLVVRSGALCMDIAGKALVGASISYASRCQECI